MQILYIQGTALEAHLDPLPIVVFNGLIFEEINARLNHLTPVDYPCATAISFDGVTENLHINLVASHGHSANYKTVWSQDGTLVVIMEQDVHKKTKD